MVNVFDLTIVKLKTIAIFVALVALTDTGSSEIFPYATGQSGPIQQSFENGRTMDDVYRYDNTNTLFKYRSTPYVFVISFL